MHDEKNLMGLLAKWKKMARGAYGTIHANNAYLALARLATLVLMEGANCLLPAIKSSIADAVQYVVHVARRRDGSRGISELLRVDGYDVATGLFQTSVWDLPMR
jgi:Flp pilus assembly CpaF family ATPase